MGRKTRPTFLLRGKRWQSISAPLVPAQAEGRQLKFSRGGLSEDEWGLPRQRQDVKESRGRRTDAEV